ncbi:uncharacterized protein MYCFIDRAFT_174789 [Pseudocercospora fijiensis CIRAD86]|uniref:Uncharacterized protein n=1 Tax=Pseudocercospora fijiensis (strain CIRAD86) TaxID=383855 RepID=M3B1U7_PSEFD|nr:uncharacterized protein MYCFIDRAFT_174789 [Pseudocercospora fijiensis CIRAD86]EME83333.1 hypothetical protein MYCFIDRAFT_174789 [Pseudocercospora fijiensis CIRAD86]
MSRASSELAEGSVPANLPSRPATVGHKEGRSRYVKIMSTLDRVGMKKALRLRPMRPEASIADFRRAIAYRSFNSLRDKQKLAVSLAAIQRSQDGVESRTKQGESNVPNALSSAKTYSSPNFDPGGQLYPPRPAPSPHFHLTAQPRYSIYDSSETKGEFIVDVKHPHDGWQQGSGGYGGPEAHGQFEIIISTSGSKVPLATSSMTLGQSERLISFDLRRLRPQLEPYRIEVSVTKKHSWRSSDHTTETELYYLPAKRTGSTAKVDNLNGGMLVANNGTNFEFKPILPFGFYTSCSDYLNNSIANVTAYRDLGFNAINPVCAYPDGDMSSILNSLDALDVWYQYDMRGSYLNLSSVAEQIPLVKDRSNLLSWYTADEPDGWQYALNSTKLAYELLKREDPYHPTGLVLNCQNYYFEEYTSGTDIIMQDAYPVGIDPHFSRKFNTTCNATYGDCGCDNCIGSLLDVSDRLETFAKYQSWLEIPQKPLWSVLQAFSGEKYWSRDPTPDETFVMMILSFNHNAKGIMSWIFPPSKSLSHAHSLVAKATTTRPVLDFLLSGDPIPIKLSSQKSVDVAFWSFETLKMVSIVHTSEDESSGRVKIELPFSAIKVVMQPWGSLNWTLSGGHELEVSRLSGYATSFVILETINESIN